jgi:hypothetical protein
VGILRLGNHGWQRFQNLFFGTVEVLQLMDVEVMEIFNHSLSRIAGTVPSPRSELFC